MVDKYGISDSNIIDNDNPRMYTSGLALSTPGAMSKILNAIWAAISAGSITIASNPQDIDSLANGGGTFTQDVDTSPPVTSLNFSFKAGQFHNGLALVSVAAGTRTLTSSATNYIEVNRAGTVNVNTSGFTSGSLPLWIVVTGVSSWPTSGVTIKKPLLTLIGANGVVGAMLSTAAQTKEIDKGLGASVSVTTSAYVIAPNVACVLTAALLVQGAAITADDTNYWTMSITNLGAAGSGSTAMLSAAAVNTTKATGGSLLAAGVARTLTLHGVPGTDANLNCNANDVLQVTVTKTASAVTLANVVVRLDFSFQT